MKKLLRNLSVLCLTLVAFLTTGCYEEEIPFLKVDHEVVLVGPQTDKGTVVVESNVNWTASSDDPWITLDNGFGNHKGTFEFFVAANTTPNERSGKITLTAEGADPVTILVRQQSEGSVLTIGTEEITFTKDAGDYLMAIACNGEWKVASSASWCTVDPASGSGNGSFKISVDENASGADRSAVITILTEADGKTEVRKVNVYQSASNAVLVVSPESKQLTSAASDFTLAVVTVGSWNASIDSDWLTLSATEGKGDAMITVNATKNDTGKERIAIITFATGAENENRVIRQIVVRQAAVDFYLIAPVTNYPLSLEAQTIEIPYVLEGSNVTVEASSSVKWMTVTSVADGVVTVNVSENGTAQAREGIIFIYTKGQEGEPITRQVCVAQAPTINLLDVLADEYAVEWTGATFRIPIYSNTEVTARSSEDWCTVAVEGSDVVITVPQNDTAMPRTAVVTVTTSSETGEILSKTTLIHQAAAYSELVVSPENKNIYSPEQSFIASIVTNNTWSANSDSDWLTIDKANGTGDYMLTVSATANTTGRVRTATITVETGIENAKRETATITVVQSPEQFFLEVPARYYPLSLDAQDIEIPYSLEGSNVSVAVSSNVSWMTVANIGEESVKVNVAENTTGQAREGIITFMTKGQAGEPTVAQVVVAQAPTVNLLDVLADEYAVEWTGETFRIPMYTNTPVTVRCTDDWCKVEVDGQDIVVKVEENLTAYAREAVVTVTTNSDKGDIINKTFVVRQAAAYSELVVAPTEKNIYSDAQSFVASIVTNNSWTASSDSEWLTIDKAAGNGDYSLTVNVAKNETGQARTAVITIQTGVENSQRETATITVLQRPEQFYFEVPTRAYLLDKSAQALKVAYTTSGNEKSVTASAGADWIRVGDVADGFVNLVIEENKTAETRTSTVTVTCTPVFGEPVSITATITQSPTVNILDAFVDKIFASAKGDEVALPYYANTPVSISSSETWCHVEITTDPNSFSATCCSYSELQKLIKITVDPNRTAEPRVAYVTISTVSDSGEKLTKVITVFQAALYASLSVTPTEIVLPAKADAEFTLNIFCTGQWNAELDCNWLKTDDSKSGVGDANIKFKTTLNDTGADRIGHITVMTNSENGKREEVVVTVIQLARDTYIEIPMAAYALTKEWQELLVGYYAAGDFTDMQVNCSEDWITYDASGSDATNLKFTVAENTTAEPRTAVVTVTLELTVGDPISDTFIVTQAPTVNILDVYTNQILASAFGQTDELTYYSNVDVNAVSSADWCKVGIDNSTDPKKIKVQCLRNESAEPRTAYVTITTITDKGEKLTHIVTVNQESLDQALSVSPERVVLPASSASFNVAIVTTSSWVIKSDATWLNLPTNPVGEGDRTVNITAADNTTGMQREAVIVVYTGSENENRVEKHIQVIQLANDTYLEVPIKEYAISSAENNAIDVAYIAAGDIKQVLISDNGSWLTYDESGSPTGFLRFKATENKTGEARTATVAITIEKASGEPVTEIVTITQAGTYNVLDVLADYVAVAAEGETFTLPALTNVTAFDVTFSAPWVKLATVTAPEVNPAFDAQNKTAAVKITAEENKTGKERLASVTIYTKTDGAGETIAKTITVYQPARDVFFSVLSSDVIYLTHDKQDVKIAAYANVNAAAITMESGSLSWFDRKGANPYAVNGNISTCTFEAQLNSSFEQRTAYIKVNYEDENGQVHERTITVVQAANDAVLATLRDYFVADPAGETVTVSFISDSNLSATSSVTWINGITITGGDVEFTVDPNTTGVDRTGYVTVKNTDLQVLITVFQPAAGQSFAVISPDIIQVSKAAGSVEISAYASNSVDKVQMASNATWLTKGIPVYNGSLVHYPFSFTQNTTGKERSATVQITWVDQKGDYHVGSVTVVQAATDHAALEAPVTYLSLGPGAESATMAFATQSGLTAASSAAWLKATVGVGNVVTFAAEANTTGLSREAVVTVSDGTKTVGITVFQAAAVNAFALLSPDIIVIGNTQTDISITAYGSTVESVDKIAMTSGSGWLTEVTADAALAGKNVTRKFSATENTTKEERIASVKVTYIDQKGVGHEASVTVIQAAAPEGVLESVVDNLSFVAAGETHTILLTASGTLTVASSRSWLKAALGTNAGEVKITADPNTTGKDRTGYVIVKLATDPTKQAVINCFQAADNTEFALLSPSVTYIGATTQNVTVSVYGSTVAAVTDVTMISGADWLTKDGNATLATKVVSQKFKATANTTGEERTADIQISYIAAGGDIHTAQATVVQAADENLFNVPIEYLTMVAAGEYKAIAYISTKDIQVTAPGGWLTATKNQNTITITADPNTTGKDRSGIVHVSNGEEIKAITVFQPAATTSFALLNPKMAVGNATGNYEFQAYCSTGATATNIQAAPSVGWLTVGSINVASSPIAKIPVTVAANTSGLPRTGLVTVTWIDQANVAHTEDIQIAQSTTENILDIYLDEIAIATKGGTHSLQYYTTAAVTGISGYSSDTNWLTVSNNSGDIRITATANNTAIDRIGYVTIKVNFQDGTKQAKVITVHQYAGEYFFQVERPNITISTAQQNIDVRYFCTESPIAAANLRYTIDGNWLTATNTAANPMIFRATNRTGTATRTGTITLYFSLPGKAPIVQTVTVRQ